MVENRFGESDGGTGLLDALEKPPTGDCGEVHIPVDPDTDQCLRVAIDPGQAGEEEIQRVLDTLSELHDAVGGDGLEWCGAQPDEGGAP